MKQERRPRTAARNIGEEIASRWPDDRVDLMMEYLTNRMFEFMIAAGGERSAVAGYLRGLGDEELVKCELALLGKFAEAVRGGRLRVIKITRERVGKDDAGFAVLGIAGEEGVRGALEVVITQRMFSIWGDINLTGGEYEERTPSLDFWVVPEESLRSLSDVKAVDNSKGVGTTGIVCSRDGRYVYEFVDVTLKNGKPVRHESMYARVGDIRLGDGGVRDFLLGLNHTRFAVFVNRGV